MNLDWVIAMGVFLAFAAWAFALYADLVAVDPQPPEAALELVADRVLDNLTVLVHELPVNVNYSNASASGVVLYVDYRWPFGKNGTRVLKSGSAQDCNLTGDRLVWRSDLTPDVNSFVIRYADRGASLACTGTFAVVNETQAFPFAVQQSMALSHARMIDLARVNLSLFKAQNRLERDFNITIENGSVLLSYGLPPPPAGDVFARTRHSRVEETGGNATVRILVW